MGTSAYNIHYFSLVHKIVYQKVHIDPESMKITLLTIYDKSEIANVKDDYIKYLLKSLL